MSIANKAVIQQSKRLTRVFWFVALFLLSIALKIVVSADSMAFSLAVVYGMAALLVGLATFIVLHSFRQLSFVEIDVDRLGSISVNTVTNSCLREPGSAISAGAGWREVAEMLPGSVIWSSLLILRLKFVSGKTLTLIIFPDSISLGSFSKLAASLLWISRLNDPAQCSPS